MNNYEMFVWHVIFVFYVRGGQSLVPYDCVSPGVGG